MGRAGSAWLLRSILLVFLVLCVRPLLAHDTPIALLELTELNPGEYLERWTYSSATNLRVPTPLYPQHCQHDPPRVLCGAQGLVGELSIDGLGRRYSAAVIRVRRKESPTQTFTLSAAQPVARLTASGKLPLSQVASTYIPLGFEHILLGIDHLLFVAGLMLLVRSRWVLLKTITAFTIAHSLTLAAVTLGWVGVPDKPVNAAIALSIVFVAVDVIKKWRGRSTLSVRFPWAVAFGFGLLHGFGFAGALSKIGLPQANLPAALLFFNVGVELGQVGFVGVVLALVLAHRQLQSSLPRVGRYAAVYAMGAVASFWALSRVRMLLEPVL